ncbi:MAG: RCC1 repeat- and reductase domain-containing protein [Nitrospirae bacterium]|nr:RCC1 repeat- and reductase domain-containing protein [Nitrospirota bacterium]
MLFSFFVAVTIIFAPAAHAIVLSGIPYAWGQGSYGQIGDGTSFNRYTPVQVSGLTGVIAIKGGGFHTVALKNDGNVWTWGANWWGQLGDGTTTDRYTPVQVSGLTGIIAIAGGGEHTIVLKNDGTIWGWGRNQFGELGDGTTTNRATPVQVSGLTGIIAIAGGYWHTIALRNDGTVWVWGRNQFGEIGDGTFNNIRPTPVQVSGLTGVVAIAGGGVHTIVLKNDGTVWAWGNNEFGQLGNGTISYYNPTPVQVSGLVGVTAIAGGEGYHTIALRNDGTVWAWGKNDYGQLGDGTTTHRNIPIHVSGLTSIEAIAGGGNHTIALKNDGTVWAWGQNNDWGQLGDGTVVNRYTPVQVSGLTGVVAIDAGFYHTLAIKHPCP